MRDIGERGERDEGPSHRGAGPTGRAARAPRRGEASRGPGGIVEVDDPDDPRLADYRDLRDPASRRRGGDGRATVVVEGKVAVQQLLRTELELGSLLVDDHQVHAAADLVAAFSARGAPVYVGRRAVVEATVGFRLHRGVVAVVPRPSAAAAERVLAVASRTPSAGGGRPIVAVLEGLTDHENVGALFRNAAAFGVAAVLCDPTCADPLYRRSVRVSSGHALSVPFARLAPWPEALLALRQHGFVVMALSPCHGAGTGTGTGVAGLEAVPLASLAAELEHRWGAPQGPARPVALLLGAEGPGLSARALAAADTSVTIRMAPGVDSLNVATAAALAFHRLSGFG